MSARRSGIVLSVIGSGSSYTPMIVREMSDRKERIGLEEIRLYDIDPRRQDIVAGFCRRLAGDKVKVTVARKLRQVLDGADFVLSQFRVGGTQMRHKDIMLGVKYGLIGQETTGIGGFAKALRTIPATMELCEGIRRWASKDAWLLNFTNPSGIITEAALKYGGVRSMGLCNAPFNLRKAVAKQIKADPKDILIDYVGANHLGWVRSVRHKGVDVSDKVRKAHVNHVAKNVPDPDRDQVFRRVMSLPYNGYLNYFYYTESMFKKIRKAKLSRAEEVALIEKALFKKYADPSTMQIPEELSKRGGQSYNLVAANLVDAMVNDLNDIHTVNIRNGGTVEDIKDDAVVEVTCRVDARGPRAVFRGALPPQFRGILQVVKAYEELTVEAGVHGDLEAALHALIVHPLGPTAGYASKLLKDLLAINRMYLPQFRKSDIGKFFKR